MSTMICSKCRSFVPGKVAACPGCGMPRGPVPTKLGGFFAIAGGSAIAMTLSACYGVPVDRTRIDASGADAGTDDARALVIACSDPTLDLDNDGFCGALDCDEANAAIHAGAIDLPGDGVDANCDGTN